MALKCHWCKGGVTGGCAAVAGRVYHTACAHASLGTVPAEPRRKRKATPPGPRLCRRCELPLPAGVGRKLYHERCARLRKGDIELARSSAHLTLPRERNGPDLTDPQREEIEKKIALYAARAAKGLPLFEEVTHFGSEQEAAREDSPVARDAG